MNPVHRRTGRCCCQFCDQLGERPVVFNQFVVTVAIGVATKVDQRLSWVATLVHVDQEILDGPRRDDVKLAGQ